MTGESFYSYISNVFFKWLQKKNVFLGVLYVDGHSSHMTLPLLKFCQQNEIELIILYPNATHIIQPLDVAIFHPLKNSYRQVLRKWRVDNNVIDFKTAMFAPVLKMALDSHDLTESIKNGFRSCGLYPFNADSVRYNILSKKIKEQTAVMQSVSTSNVQNSDSRYSGLMNVFERDVISSDMLEAFKKSECDNAWTAMT